MARVNPTIIPLPLRPPHKFVNIRLPPVWGVGTTKTNYKGIDGFPYDEDGLEDFF